MTLRIAQVVVDIRAAAVDHPFTYLVPDGMRDRAIAGALAIVPFGTRLVPGYIVRVQDCNEGALPLPRSQLRDLAEVSSTPAIDAASIQLAEWIATEYAVGLASVVQAMVPPPARERVRTMVELTGEPAQNSITVAQQRLLNSIAALGGRCSLRTAQGGMTKDAFAKLLRQLRELGLVQQSAELAPAPRVPKTPDRVTLTASQEQTNAFLLECGKRRASQASLLIALMEHPDGAMSKQQLLQTTGVGESALFGLVRSGLANITAEGAETPATAAAPTLTRAQTTAVDSILAAMGSRTFSPFLLYGVTASGKTEVYLRTAAECLRRGRGVIYLVPEIALTAQVVARVRARFGSAVAVLHSHLSDGERFDQWQRIRSGEAPVVVGARSAIFAPVPHLGLVVIDEEHEPSYKQESRPRYHTRHVAMERARREGAVVVFGSATPSLESYHAAQRREYQLLELTERIPGRSLPDVEVLNLRNEARGATGAISPPLQEAVRDALGRGGQVILFLNRRAFAAFLLCRQCGYVPACNHCSVSLAYHRASGILRCHHCGHSERAPLECAVCSAKEMKPFGVGTQRIEDEARQLFPEANIARLDRDVLARKDAFREVLRAFATGEVNILVGTQMVAKGLDFPGVSVVGIVNADTAMNLPDFRAGERTFQLLTQVAGRAGRGELTGRVIAQTFTPEHPAVAFGSKHDFLGFYAHEIEQRRALNYPPFSRLANIIASHATEQTAQDVARRITNALRKAAPPGCEVLGPSACPIERVKGVYRWHCLLKAPLDIPVGLLCGDVVKSVDTQDANVIVDVDPQSMM